MIDENFVFCEIEYDKIYKIFKNKFNPNLDYKIQLINIDDISPTSNYIYIKRFDYAQNIIDLYKCNEIELFKPIQKIYSNTIQYIAPPIVEIRNNYKVLCDGTHRVYAARQLGIKNIYVMVVNNAVLPLAGNINIWGNIKISQVKYKLEDNFINFNKDGFTGYSRFCNSDNFIFIK